MSVSGVEIIQQKEDVSTVRYPMLFKSTRQSTSMLILVSLTNSKFHETILYSYSTSVHANSFTYAVDIGPVTISPGTSVTKGAGEYLSLECSVEIIIPNPLPQNMPNPVTIVSRLS